MTMNTEFENITQILERNAAEWPSDVALVEIDTPGSLHPVAIEMDSGEDRTGNVDLTSGESYISADGREWESAQEKSYCNICLKAFTTDR